MPTDIRVKFQVGFRSRFRRFRIWFELAGVVMGGGVGSVTISVLGLRHWKSGLLRRDIFPGMFSHKTNLFFEKFRPRENTVN